jgi:hypothetical protein
MGSFRTCTPQGILFWLSNQGGWDGHGMWHIRGRGGICTGFFRVNLQDGDHLEDLVIAKRRILKWVLKK